MTLSDIKGERTFDVLSDIFESVCDIAKDKRVYKLFQQRECPKGMSADQFGLEIVLEACDGIIKYHKKECITIMASLAGVSEEEYLENLNMMQLLNDLFELISDPQIQTLFFSQETPTE